MMKSRGKIQYVIECAGRVRLAGEWRDDAGMARADAETLEWVEYEYAEIWRRPECAVRFGRQVDLLYDIKNIHRDRDYEDDLCRCTEGDEEEVRC